MKITLSLSIERTPKKPAETDTMAPGAVVGTMREAKGPQARQRAAGRGTVGFFSKHRDVTDYLTEDF